MTPGTLIDNYIYLYHIPGDNRDNGVGSFVIIPTFPESYSESLNAQFAQ